MDIRFVPSHRPRGPGHLNPPPSQVLQASPQRSRLKKVSCAALLRSDGGGGGSLCQIEDRASWHEASGPSTVRNPSTSHTALFLLVSPPPRRGGGLSVGGPGAANVHFVAPSRGLRTQFFADGGGCGSAEGWSVGPHRPTVHLRGSRRTSRRRACQRHRLEGLARGGRWKEMTLAVKEPLHIYVGGPALGRPSHLLSRGSPP